TAATSSASREVNGIRKRCSSSLPTARARCAVSRRRTRSTLAAADPSSPRPSTTAASCPRARDAGAALKAPFLRKHAVFGLGRSPERRDIARDRLAAVLDYISAHLDAAVLRFHRLLRCH